METIDRHNNEIQQNLDFWNNKPILHTIYGEFYSFILAQINHKLTGKIVELGSGIGNLKEYLPESICTDLFSNPWIDQVEDAYKLSFEDSSVSNLILFDVFHHIEYPQIVLKEFFRVLEKGGRVIIFEPSISLLGWIVYGFFHKEDVAWFKKIKRQSSNIDTDNLGYYAAQGNASRIFLHKKYKSMLEGFDIVKHQKLAAIAYVMSGGYSSKQLFPDKMYPKIKCFEKFANHLPFLFSTRLLVVLEKK